MLYYKIIYRFSALFSLPKERPFYNCFEHLFFTLKTPYITGLKILKKLWKGQNHMKKIQTEKAPAAIGPYSQAIIAGNVLYTSGQIPLDPETGRLCGETIEAQTEQVLKNLDAILRAAGSGPEKTVKTTCFLKNINDFAAFNEIYGKYFTNKPARSCVDVSALPKNALVEMEAVALLSE